MREGSISSENPITPPRIPVKSRARAYTSPEPKVDLMVERIASALIEKDRLQAEIESIIERQSIYINSRPSTAYGIPELEPMPSIPALPDAGPSFAERLSSDGRPHTAPAQGARDAATNKTSDAPRDLAAAAFNSHPPFVCARGGTSPTTPRAFRSDDRYLERPLAPPLPLVLRPPLRKKKSFSRVSSWLFLGDSSKDSNYQRRDMSVSSVTNAPRPIRGNEGFYQPAALTRRDSFDSDSSSLRTWETTTTEEEEEEERQTVPTTTMSSPVVQSTPRQTPVVERVSKFPWMTATGGSVAQGSGAGLAVKTTVQGPRPQSVGVAF